MSFTTLSFFVFFIVVLGSVCLLQKLKRNFVHVFLLIVSYFFYGYWDWRFCFLLLFVTVVAYFSALFAHRNFAFAAGVITPLVVLAFFKYFNFFVESFSALIKHDIGTLKIILPVGISFYTFQALSYVIDVKRKKIESEKDFIKLALYISFFPQLVAGPIVKASDFLPQLYENRFVTLKGVEQGVQLMVFGFLKKVVIADHLSVFVDDVFFAPAAYSWISIILAVISYSIQIYFDFSGYSDIAIGCAKCFGYDFCPNFNLPYVSETVTEFWRRWHISLSSWLREYLYIPLGGNRKGKFRQALNLLVTMLLGGLWHGANWTFVFWGGTLGIGLCVDKFLFCSKKEKTAVVRILSTLGTLAFISFTWIFFRADTFGTAWLIIKGIFTLQEGIIQPFFWSFVAIIILIVSTVFAVRRSKKQKLKHIEGYYPTVKLNTISGLTVFFLVCGLICCLAYVGENPFVYFQF